MFELITRGTPTDGGGAALRSPVKIAELVSINFTRLPRNVATPCEPTRVRLCSLNDSAGDCRATNPEQARDLDLRLAIRQHSLRFH